MRLAPLAAIAGGGGTVRLSSPILIYSGSIMPFLSRSGSDSAGNTIV